MSLLKHRLKNALPDGAQKFLHTYNHHRALQTLAHFMGYHLWPLHDSYSPLPSRKQLRATRARWYRPSALHGVRYSIDRFRETLRDLLQSPAAELEQLAPYGVIVGGEFGSGYNENDGFVLYMMLRYLKPRRYLAVGSGVSMYYCGQAALRNALEGRPLEITCIDDSPNSAVYSLPSIRVVEKEVQDESVRTFSTLERGDVLFIDSSHTLRIDSDVAYLLLEVLPVLRPGVNIHISDVPFPYNIPFPAERWVLDRTWPAYWNEAMVLQALLCNNSGLEITMSLPLLRYHDESMLARMMPRYKTVEDEPKTFSSIWLRVN